MVDATPLTTLSVSAAETTSNFSTTDSPKFADAPDEVLHVLLPVVYSIICGIGLMGNTLVIYIVASKSAMRTVANSYIVNLAIADELFLLAMPFLGVGYATWNWPFGPVMCKLVFSADSVNQFASVFCLTAMSVDRYQAVVHPMSSRGYRTVRRAVVINIVIWILALLVVSPVVVFTTLYKTVADSEENFFCNIKWPEPKEAWNIAFIAYTGVIGFAVPLTIITVCAVFIVRSFRRHRHSKRAKGQARDSRRLFRKRERTITRVVFAVVVTFFVCWLPFYLFNVINLAVPSIMMTTQNKWMFHFLVSLSYGNSCLNPLIYIVLNSHCRKNVWDLCCSWTGIDPSRSADMIQVTSIRLSSLSRAPEARR